jgi:hypothetical protein
MDEKRYAIIYCRESQKVRYHYEKSDFCGWIILRWILVWTALVWLGIDISGGLL